MGSVNFGFLGSHEARLETLAGQAERYFQDDPATAIVKLRQFAELTAKLIAARTALYRDARETFEETLRRLSYERIIPKEVADVFHTLRKVGNVAVHEARGDRADALTALKLAHSLGIWFHRTNGCETTFRARPSQLPPGPVDATAPLRQEIDDLRRKVAESAVAPAIAPRIAESRCVTIGAIASLNWGILASWIASGFLDELVASNRDEIIARKALARDVLAGVPFFGNDRCPHIWLPLMVGANANEVVSRLFAQGGHVFGSNEFKVGGRYHDPALRISLSAAANRVDLVRSLTIIRDFVTAPDSVPLDGIR